MLASLIRPTLLAARPALRSQAPRAAFQPFRTVVTTRYTIDHEWITLDSDTGLGTIGVTDYAQQALGDVVYVEVPEVNSIVEAGKQIGAVESVKAASDIFAPVSGRIAAVNEELDGQPGLLNKSPEQDGWLAKIELSNQGQFDELLNAEAYKAHCEGAAETS